MNSRKILGVLAVAMTFLFVEAIPANAMGGPYELQSGYSNACAWVPASTADGKPVEQIQCLGSDWELWYTRDIQYSNGRQWFEIINVYTGKCLDAQWATTPGIPVVQYTCYGGATQLWGNEPISGSLTYAKFHNGNGTLCLSNQRSSNITSILSLGYCSGGSEIAWTWF